MTQFKYIGNNEYGLDVYRDTHREITYVEIPYTYVGSGSTVLFKANNLALGSDSERCGQMNIDDLSDVFGSRLVAIVDEYTDEQWELLSELLGNLFDYPVYDEETYHKLEYESQLDAVKDMLYPREDIDPHAVLQAIFELSVPFIEEEGENWYISEQDFNAAIQYAIRNNL